MNPFHFPDMVLASQSPRRAELLRQIGVPFEVVLPLDPHAAEVLEAVLPDELPLAYVQRVCRAKAQMMRRQIAEHGSPEQQNRPILCADTTVAFGDEILGKPANAHEVHTMLNRLSGQTHQVHTAVTIAWQGAMMEQVVSSDVTFRPITSEEIEAYVHSGEPFGKAGAYAIQGYGACFVEHLRGSFSAVKGLPIFEVAQMLRALQNQA